MFDSRHKLAVFGALSVAPNYSRLPSLKKLHGANFGKFLRWLDRGGLSLYFLSHVTEGGMEKELPDAILRALEESLRLNQARTDELLQDFRVISEVLTARDVPHVALKGFTLAPEFCSRFELRHQADIDLWIEPNRIPDALSALATREFVAQTFGPDSAVTLAGPGDGRVSVNESVYRPGRARRIELHAALAEDIGPVVMKYPAGQWERTRARRFGDIGYRCLCRPDMFVFQVFHAFKHVMKHWVRPSWLYEISHFLAVNEGDDSLWEEVCRSIGEDPLFRDALGLVIDLAQRSFGCRIPPILQQFCVDHLPARIALWNEHFGEQFVRAELYGDKASLFVQHGFVRDAAVWRAHVRKRLLPLSSNPALSEIRGPALPQSFSDRWNKISLLRMKAAFHLKCLARYPYQSVRWHWIQRGAEL
jgi:hypothetical protein